MAVPNEFRCGAVRCRLWPPLGSRCWRFLSASPQLVPVSREPAWPLNATPHRHRCSWAFCRRSVSIRDVDPPWWPVVQQLDQQFSTLGLVKLVDEGCDWRRGAGTGQGIGAGAAGQGAAAFLGRAMLAACVKYLARGTEVKVNSDRFAVVASVIDQHPAVGQNHIVESEG